MMYRLVLFFCVLSFSLSSFSGLTAYDPSADGYRLLSTVRYYLKHDYVSKNVQDKALEYGAIRGMLASLKDPYTRFLEPKVTKEMRVRLSGQFYGVGIHIGIRERWLTVISPISGTPADRAGLRSLDKIVEIDGKSSVGMGLQEAVSLIRGKKGTPVVLTIKRDGKKQTFPVTIIRDKIRIPAVEKKEIFKDKVGYIRLVTFENRFAYKEVLNGVKAFQEDENVQGLILDLRNNGGGLLKNAIDIASIFIEEGPVVHKVDREDHRETD